MGIQTLNEDALDAVFTYLSSREARKLCSTARMFYATARKHAVKEVTTHSFRQAVRFCHRMTLSSPDLLPWLQSLRLEFCSVTIQKSNRIEVDEEEVYRAGAAQIADVLQGAANLKVLALHEAELLMVYEPRVAAIFTSMHSLRELELHDIGPRVLDALRRLQSTPDKMALAGCTPWPSFASAYVPKRWYRSAGLTNVSFRGVHALSLQDGYHFPDLDKIAHAFPNVVQLDIGVHPQRAMELFRPVAVTVAMSLGYGFLKELFAYDRNPRLRYIKTEDPCSHQSLHDYLSQLQGMWVSNYCPRLNLCAY